MHICACVFIFVSKGINDSHEEVICLLSHTCICSSLIKGRPVQSHRCYSRKGVPHIFKIHCKKREEKYMNIFVLVATWKNTLNSHGKDHKPESSRVFSKLGQSIACVCK